MASEDIIELGSSDDETEPAPKKAKLNAMVHIPHDLVIAPVKPTLPSLHKKFSGKPITIRKIPNNHSAAEVKNNKKTHSKPLARPVVKPIQKRVHTKQALNPISVKMSNSQVAINRVTANVLKEPIKIPPYDARSFSTLTSSKTIPKTMPVNKYVNVKPWNKINKNTTLQKVTLPSKQNKFPNSTASKCSVSTVPTLDLDDDEANPVPAVTKGPQWYLRPEEQQKGENIEKQNNSDSKSSEFIEITIEDSPVKPVKTHEIGAEFPITIEDSPIRLTEMKDISNCSDEENQLMHRTPKTKKKLEYPNDNVSNATESVEIEIGPMVVNIDKEEISKNELVQSVITTGNILEIDTAKIKDKNELEVPAKLSSPEVSQLQKSNTDCNEDNVFHPVYQSFIDLCFELENSEDMQRIMDKKIKGYYLQVPKEYRESEDFLEMVSSKIILMKAGPERMYLYIKDIVDELNFKRKSLHTNAPSIQETNNKEAEKFFYGEESEFDSKRQRQIHKLEKTLKKLHKAIQKLEEQEVDFDDEEDSVYLLTERYKERMIRVHAKFCQLTNTKMPSEPPIHIEPRPGRPTGPAKRLQKMINKKVPIGTPLPFPDFHDVLRCVREANAEDKLCWNDADVMDEARDLFTRCGKKLQRRRQENEWRLAASRISAEVDPALDSDELKKKLEQNKLLADKNETELLNKYADKQKQMKLEAVEIGDKEAEESPVESEDDIQEVPVTSDDSERRKKRVKILLQEKTTNKCEDNANQSTSDLDREIQINDINENERTEINMKEEECSNIKIKCVESLSKTINKDDKVQAPNDDTDTVSNVDELNLLKILHSEPEVNEPSQNSSDSDSLIAISDSLDSGSDSKKHYSDDVISIENSSYSESEADEDENMSIIAPKFTIQETVKETSSNFIESKVDQTNNNEYTESSENILLASSSEEECETEKRLSACRGGTYVNLKDDTISIGETIIEGIDTKVNKLNEKEDIENVIEQQNETPVKVNEQQEERWDSQTSDVSNDKTKPKETVLNEKQINNLEETISSAINDNAVNVSITSETISNEISSTPHKENNECDSGEIVGSTTEKMEVVTTTSPCDDVNG